MQISGKKIKKGPIQTRPDYRDADVRVDTDGKEGSRKSLARMETGVRVSGAEGEDTRGDRVRIVDTHLPRKGKKGRELTKKIDRKNDVEKSGSVVLPHYRTLKGKRNGT